VIRVTFFDSCSCFKKSDSSSCSCSGTLWKLTLRLLFALRKLEGNVYFASWSKLTVRAILPLPNMDKLHHGLSAGKELALLFCIACLLISWLNPSPSCKLQISVSLCVILSSDQFNKSYSTKGKIIPAQCFSPEEKRQYQTWNQEIESYVIVTWTRSHWTPLVLTFRSCLLFIGLMGISRDFKKGKWMQYFILTASPHCFSIFATKWIRSYKNSSRSNHLLQKSVISDEQQWPGETGEVAVQLLTKQWS